MTSPGARTLGGKADMTFSTALSAFDPKRTSVTITPTHRQLSTAMADHPTEARAISIGCGAGMAYFL